MSTSGKQANRHEVAKKWIGELKQILHRKWNPVNKDDTLFDERCKAVINLLQDAERHDFHLLPFEQEPKKTQAKQFKVDVESLRSQFTAALERGKRISEQPLKTDEKQKQLLTVSLDIKVVREKLETCIQQATRDLTAKSDQTEKGEKSKQDGEVGTSKLREIYKDAYKSFLEVAKKKDKQISEIKTELGQKEPGKTARENAIKLLKECKARVEELIKDPLKITRTTPELIKQEELLLAGVGFWTKQANRDPDPMKKGRDVNEKAYAQWIKLLTTAERAKKQLESMPGTEVFHRRLSDKIAGAQNLIQPLTKGGSIMTGHLLAIANLQDFQEIVNQAIVSYQNATNAGLPNDVNLELQRAKEAAFQYKQAGPDSRYQALMDEINRSAEQWQIAIKQSPQREQEEISCLKKAEELATRIEKEAEQLRESKEKAESASRRFGDLIDKLIEGGVAPSLYAEYLRVGKKYSLLQPVDSKDRKPVISVSKDWPTIEHNLTNACSGLNDIVDTQLDAARKWSEFQKAATAFKHWAGPLVAVPVLRRETARVLGLVNDIELRFKTTQELIQCVEMVEKEKCVEAIDALRKKAFQQVEQVDNNNSQALAKTLVESTKELTKAILSEREQLQIQLADLDEELKLFEQKTDNPKELVNHPLRKGLDSIRSQWEQDIEKLGVKDFKPVLTEATKKGLKACDTLRNKISEARKDVAKYRQENFQLSQAKQDDPTATLRRLIAEAKAYDIDTAEHENVARKPYEENREPFLKSRLALEKALRESKHQFEEKKQRLETKVKSVRDFLDKQTNWKFGNFRGFRDEIKAQHLDLAAMVESDDPQLMELALGMADELNKKIDEVRPGDGEKSADERYKKVVEYYEALSAELGGHGKKVPHKLPDTYDRISKALIAAIAKCEKSSPTAAMELLKPFWGGKLKDGKPEKIGKATPLKGGFMDGDVMRKDVPRASETSIGLHIDKAVNLAQQHKQLNELFKEAVKEIQAEWSGKTLGPNGAKKDLKAGDTDCDYFEKWFSARLKEAEKARHGENGIFRAGEILADVKARLKAISPIDPKTGKVDPKLAEQKLIALRQYNNQDKADFELLCNLARQFEAKVLSLKEVTLKQALEYVSESEDGDKDLVASLSKTVDAAVKIVEPYLFNISKLPHRSGLLADNAPNMTVATSNFNSADAMLDDVRDSANRLMSTGNSTNVNITKDLLEVERTWFDGVAAFKRALKQTLDRIRDIDLNQEENKKAEPAVVTARSLVEGLESVFNETAFSKAFEKLREEEVTGLLKSDRKKRKQQRLEKLASREEALRIMRDFRSRLYSHPVIATLSDKQTNPVTAQPVIEALAVVNVALKRVEIQSLIGVPS